MQQFTLIHASTVFYISNFEGDGNLATALKLDSGNSGIINDLALETYKSKSIATSATLTSSQTVPPTNTYLDTFSSDVRLTIAPTDTNSATYQFNEWNRYTDVGAV
jgi:hypothetical protein